MEIPKEDFKKLFIFMAIGFILAGFCIGIVSGKYIADRKWKEYHADYKKEIAAHCSYDPEQATNNLPEMIYNLGG